MKTYDITEKMNFEDNPVITFKGNTFTVNADAKTVMLLVEISERASNNFMATMQGYNVVFSEADRKKIDKLKLNSHDFGVLVDTAVALAIGIDPDAEDEGNE